MNAKMITTAEKANTFVLRRRFVLSALPEAARLRATALGLYFVRINGRRVGEDFLAPGFTSYHKMVQWQSYDALPYLCAGENVLEMTVNAGWYAGRFGCEDKGAIYGEAPAGALELEADGTVLCTDESWEAAESPVRFAGIYDGERADFTAPCKPLTPVPAGFDAGVLVPQMCEPVRTTQRLPVQRLFTTPKGETVYDFGQNIAGVCEVETGEDFAGTLTLTFAEVLDGDGNFYTENLRSAEAKDTLCCRGRRVYAPEFTYHGFRYMRMEGGTLPADKVFALVRHSDMKRTGRVATGQPLFDRLLANVVWGQRGNFVDIPTDCPQRDERMGWTGDINVFCRTAAYNFDIRSFMKKWLATLRQDQYPTGEVPLVVPDVFGGRSTDALWSSAVAMVPWTLYEMYGDVSFLADNFTAMKKYLAALENNTERGLMARGHEYGDWLSFDNEPSFRFSCVGATDVYFIADVFYAVTLDTVAKTAGVLGEAETAARCRARREKLLADMYAEFFTPRGRLAVDTVTARVLLLHFGLAPAKLRPRLAAELNAMVEARKFRVTTGFAGTPYLLFALADNGYADTAAKLLLNEDCPGWLNEVKLGATTVWERWNSYLASGPDPDAVGMNSYNHYAYGSFMEFFYRRVAGIEAAAPGFAAARIAPTPLAGFDAVRAEYESVRGRFAAGYEKHGNVLHVFAEIPQGCAGEVWLPRGTEPAARGSGSFSFDIPWGK